MFQQHGMPDKCFAESAPEGHDITLRASPLAQIVVGGQNLAAAVGISGDRLAMAPAESSAPDLSGNAG